MTKKSISTVSLEWLDWMSNDPRFIGKNGETCLIQHGWNYGEKKMGTYFLDGYVMVNDHHYVLEFLGCRFHYCDKCQISINGPEVSYYINEPFNLIFFRICFN
jgi:hypothetical protein